MDCERVAHLFCFFS